MEPVRNDTTADRRTAVELAKRLLVDLIWRTAKIEVDGVTFPDTQEIFDGRAPEGMSMVDAATDHTRTLSARYGKDGSEILVSRGEGKNPRRLTPRECARLMGYPDSFSIPVSDTQAYRQFGNSVAVPVIRAIGEAMKPYLSD